MPTYSCCVEKKLVYIIIIALFSHQPSSCVKCTKLNIRPYKKLNKEVKDFKEYYAELGMLYTIKYFYLTVGTDCEYYKET